jgi:energy-coupling factor transporter ATP-binding protein EcfA2
MERTFDSVPTPLEIAKNKIPQLGPLLAMRTSSEQERFAALMQDVTQITRQNISKPDLQGSATSIRNFYKGFKPSWTDLIEDIPAVLQQYAQLSAEFRQGASEGKRFFPVTGPAGSGKSTFTKWLALKLSDESSRVYFVDKASQNTLEIIKELSRSNPSQNFFVFVERLDPIKQDIHDALDKVPNAIIIGPESQTVWSSRLVSEFDAVLTCKLLMHEIDEQDVPLILEKLQRFGPWTRLSNMTLNERKRELYVRSRRQLLIGLMETTTGVGFEEIINRDYEAIADKGDRLFFTAVCVSTMHKAALSLSVAARLLNSSGIARAPATMSSRLDGLVESRRDGFTARHPIYARKMIESVVSPEMIFSATTALLMAFTVYPHPVVTSLDKNDATLFKSLFNHKFLTSVLRIEANVLKFYSQFEKLFESDGLFWLQYGLALRDFKRHREAYDILQTAYNAYPHYHTTHALAQQKLILSASDLVTDSSARAYLAEAIKLLDGLDDTFESDDTYPIVTLAEGHVKALKVLDGVSVARIKASEYVRVLEQRLRRNSNARLDAARASLMSFSLTGNFKDEDWS